LANSGCGRPLQGCKTYSHQRRRDSIQGESSLDEDDNDHDNDNDNDKQFTWDSSLDNDGNDDKPVWPTRAVGALLRGARRIHITHVGTVYYGKFTR
jgi:hypothetical protein